MSEIVPVVCGRCNNTGRVIIAMSCIGPHLYGPCPKCKGGKRLVEALKDEGIVLIGNYPETEIE